MTICIEKQQKVQTLRTKTTSRKSTKREQTTHIDRWLEASTQTQSLSNSRIEVFVQVH